MWMVTAALSGCGGGGSTRDAGGGGLDAAGGGTTDAPIPPGTDAPMLARPDSAAPPGTLCDDSCMYAGDMECDDGGPDSMTSVCAFGTDCSDCGPRDPADCMPRCDGRNCGDDGCGGTCGECTGAETCMGGTCGVCTPDCTDAMCGDDGCGGNGRVGLIPVGDEGLLNLLFVVCLGLLHLELLDALVDHLLNLLG